MPEIKRRIQLPAVSLVLLTCLITSRPDLGQAPTASPKATQSLEALSYRREGLEQEVQKIESKNDPAKAAQLRNLQEQLL